MKKIFIFICSLLSLLGCAAINQKPVYYESKEVHIEKERYYDQLGKPVTGIIIEENSDTYITMSVKDGFLDGPSVYRRTNSESVYTFKRGERISAVGHDNGRLSWETYYKNNEEYKTVTHSYRAGELSSIITQTGNKIVTQIYKDGKLDSEKVEYEPDE